MLASGRALKTLDGVPTDREWPQSAVGPAGLRPDQYAFRTAAPVFAVRLRIRAPDVLTSAPPRETRHLDTLPRETIDGRRPIAAVAAGSINTFVR